MINSTLCGGKSEAPSRQTNRRKKPRNPDPGNRIAPTCENAPVADEASTTDADTRKSRSDDVDAWIRHTGTLNGFTDCV